MPPPAVDSSPIWKINYEMNTIQEDSYFGLAYPVYVVFLSCFGIWLLKTMFGVSISAVVFNQVVAAHHTDQR